MPIQSIDNFTDYFNPFSSDNLPATSLILVGVVAFAYINREAFYSPSESNRVIENLEPQAEVNLEEIKALQDENELLKYELSEFECSILHPLIDAPMKCGKIALLEEKALLKGRITIGRPKKAGRVLIQKLNRLGYSLPDPIQKESKPSYWSKILEIIKNNPLHNPQDLQRVTTAIEKRIKKLKKTNQQ